MTIANNAPYTTRTAFALWGAGLGSTLPPGPLGRFGLPYNLLTDAQKTVLETFHRDTCRGRYNRFIYLDPMGNLAKFSELFTEASWEKYSTSAAAPGSTDPFGGSLASVVTGSGSNSMLATSVVPDGFAPSGYVLCASVWAKSAAGQTLSIGFIDAGFTVLASQIWALPAGQWVRISCPIALSTSSAIRMLIGGFSTWGATALTLFGAMCAPLPGPGGYVASPSGYGYHPKCRFDSDVLEFVHRGPNATACNAVIQEIF